MPRKDPEAYKAYMKEYMKKKYAREKGIKVKKMTNDDFNVAKAVFSDEGKQTMDLNGKVTKTLIETAKKASKDDDTDEEDPIFKTIEKVMKYAPVITELFKGFSAAASNFKETQRPVQQQAPSMQPPSGWESMSPLQRMSKKYTQPEWYSAGERWEQYKATGNSGVTVVNPNYVDSSYNQAVQQREARTLAELSKKHPEPPIVSDSQPVTQDTPQKKPEFVRQRVKDPEPSKEEIESQAETEIINKMREDNNKYIELAFNYLKDMKIKDFEDSVNNIESFKPKFDMLKLLLPIQTKEMLKATTSDELVLTFKEKCPIKHKWLKDHKKINEMKKIFEELKAGL